MNTTSSTGRSGLKGMLALNGVLIGALVFATIASSVGAQGGFRARGNYHAAVGNIPGSEAGAIFVVDETNQQLIGLTIDPATKKLGGIGGRDLAVDARQLGRRN